MKNVIQKLPVEHEKTKNELDAERKEALSAVERAIKSKNYVLVIGYSTKQDDGNDYLVGVKNIYGDANFLKSVATFLTSLGDELAEIRKEEIGYKKETLN